MTETILEKFEPYYAAAFPERAGAKITHLATLNNGWESDVYAFDVEWGASESRLTETQILRIYPGNDAEVKSAREFHALAELQKLGYPVPRVYRLEPAVTSPFGKPFLVMERIPGRGMWHQMFHSPPDERERLLDRFCALFARLHALDPRPFDPALQPGQNAVQCQLARWQGYVDSLPLPGFLPAWQWVSLRAPEIHATSFSPCHWDFHPDNILLDEVGNMVVIDWTGLEVTDRRFDVAWTLLLICSNEGASAREPVLRGYERHAGVTLTDMNFFDAVACFRRLFSVLVSLALGAEKMGMRSGAEEMMRAHTRPLRFVYERWLALTSVPIPDAEDFLRESSEPSGVR